MIFRGLFISGILFCASTWAIPLALDAQIGAAIPDQKISQTGVDIAGHLWYKFDQMVFIGAGGGYQRLGNLAHKPLLAGLWIRLPVGGQILPVLIGDIGADISDKIRFIWRAAGGLDIKNGDRSSLLISGGYQSIQDHKNALFIRGGLLLEF